MLLLPIDFHLDLGDAKRLADHFKLVDNPRLLLLLSQHPHCISQREDQEQRTQEHGHGHAFDGLASLAGAQDILRQVHLPSTRRIVCTHGGELRGADGGADWGGSTSCILCQEPEQGQVAAGLVRRCSAGIDTWGKLTLPGLTLLPGGARCVG